MVGFKYSIQSSKETTDFRAKHILTELCGVNATGLWICY